MAGTSEPIPVAAWHALCLDATDQPRLAGFWAAAIGRGPDAHDSTHLAGEEEYEQVRVDAVPEPKAAKNPVRSDVPVPDVAPLLDRGTRMPREPDAEISWHVLADPEGDEFCARTA